MQAVSHQKAAHLRPTLDDLDNLPATNDHAAIAAIIEQHIRKVGNHFSRDSYRQKKFWARIEQLAQDPFLSGYQRWLLLADPTILTDPQSQARFHLLLASRSQPFCRAGPAIDQR